VREIQLGLGNPPVRRFLFVQQDERDPTICWHELDFSTTPPKQIPVPQSALTGYITGIKVKEVDQGSYGKKWKLVILMDAGEEFAIQTSTTTTFARNILQALSAIEKPEELTGPLTIAVSPGEKKNVFGAVFIKTTGRRVKVEWDKTQDLAPLIKTLQSVFGDGGQDEDAEPERANYSSDGDDAPPFADVTKPNAANEAQLLELKRCGVLAGLAHKPPEGDLDISELNQHCAKLYEGKKIHELTRDQAIEYRKTLLAI
jgi:hypothetical protein